MEDVIFVGIFIRIVFGCVEVIFIIDNSDGVFFIEYIEVFIIWCMFWDGVSEYEINGDCVCFMDV